MIAFPPFALTGSKFRVSRRGFIAGAAVAALPTSHLWADVPNGALPTLFPPSAFPVKRSR